MLADHSGGAESPTGRGKANTIMMAVIADDFTGAAELAGVAFKCGASVEIICDSVGPSNAEVVIVATDTRSKSEARAYEEVKSLITQIRDEAALIYKKTDSVLRGHVVVELNAMAEVMGKQRVLLVPANPAHGRFIKDGIYYVNGYPVHKTEFANDPEYPLLTSNVLEILGHSNGLPVLLLADSTIPIPAGIVVAEIATAAELDLWAQRLDEETIPAGAAGFFSSVLKARGYQSCDRRLEVSDFGKRALIICGSAFSHGQVAAEEASARQAAVCKMPDEVFYNGSRKGEAFTKWVEEASRLLETTGKVVVEMNRPVIKSAGFARGLRERVAEFVEAVLQRVQLGELFIDGGATAYAIVKRLQLRRFTPCAEIVPGVTRLEVKDQPKLHLTVKAGSYQWPDELWAFD